jgi:hypothetical protein
MYPKYDDFRDNPYEGFPNNWSALLFALFTSFAPSPRSFFAAPFC